METPPSSLFKLEPEIYGVTEALRCSQCAGPIKADAVRCEYCGYWFKEPNQIDSPSLEADPRKIGRFYMDWDNSWKARFKRWLEDA